MSITILHFLAQLLKTRMTSPDMVKLYTTLVRPLVKYAYQVWHSVVTGKQSAIIESIQNRAQRMIYPSMSYEEALKWCNIRTLSACREAICKKNCSFKCVIRNTNYTTYSLTKGQANTIQDLGKSIQPLSMVQIDLQTHLWITLCSISRHEKTRPLSQNELQCDTLYVILCSCYTVLLFIFIFNTSHQYTVIVFYPIPCNCK